MEIVGKIIFALPEVSGTSKAGKPWKKREYVLETQDNYPSKVCFNFFGDKADQYPLTVGQLIKLSFDINSREFNGRWYTDISGWKAEPVEGTSYQQPAPAAAANPYGVPPLSSAPAPAPLEPPTASDDLPF
ncbi:MAG: DUF3127 domain-containing protein [Muribaculaceae bacterium]|nr:DUF3127 domain-containing protein [Muribaculaceae bacterium]